MATDYLANRILVGRPQHNAHRNESRMRKPGRENPGQLTIIQRGSRRGRGYARRVDRPGSYGIADIQDGGGRRPRRPRVRHQITPIRTRPRAVTICGSAAEAAEDCDLVCVALFSDDQVEETLAGEDGLFPILRPGTVVAVFTTGTIASARKLAAASPAGVAILDTCFSPCRRDEFPAAEPFGRRGRGRARSLPARFRDFLQRDFPPWAKAAPGAP